MCIDEARGHGAMEERQRVRENKCERHGARGWEKATKRESVRETGEIAKGRVTLFTKHVSTRLQRFNLFTLLDVCVSSLRRGHANLLCIVPS